VQEGSKNLPKFDKSTKTILIDYPTRPLSWLFSANILKEKNPKISREQKKIRHRRRHAFYEVCSRNPTGEG
jgi:hypothetical protein